MTPEFAQHFAQEWVAAWNSHNLTEVLSHYTDDFEMASPVISQMNIAAEGKLKGKEAIKDYWQQALERIPNLHFKLLDILIGADSIVLYYLGHRGQAAEIFYFDDQQKVYKAAAHYAIARPQ